MIDIQSINRLDGKVAIVTGASYGLGVLFAEILATAGADVVVTARSVDKLRDTKAMIESLGRRCLVVEGDVTSFEDCDRVATEAMAAFGKIDILVNNAGWADDRLIRTEHCEPEMFAQMVNTDLIGLFYMTRAAAPHMLRGGGGSIGSHVRGGPKGGACACVSACEPVPCEQRGGDECAIRRREHTPLS